MRWVRSFLAAIMVAGLGLGLAGCETPQPAPQFPALSYTDKPVIRLDVAQIKVVNEYQMPFKAPNIEHQMPVAPAAAAERWGHDVLRGVGRSGSAMLVIREAGVSEVPLETKKGITGIFYKEQSERYDAKLVATLILRDDRNNRLGEVSTEAVRTNTTREDTTPNQRAQIWYDMVKALMEDFDKTMRAQTNQHLGQFLR